MLWNPNVLNTRNVAESEVADEAATDNLLCDGSFTLASALPGSSELKTDSSTSSTDKVVGWSTENVMIYSGLNSSNDDALEELSE